MKQFWQWWSDGLGAPWSPRVRKWLGQGKTRTWVAPLASGYRFISQAGSDWKTIAETTDDGDIPGRTTKRLESGTAVLRIPRDQAIVRSFTIADGDEAARHVESRLDECSPLPTAQRYFDSMLSDGKLTLAIARKSWVDEKLEELAGLGVIIDQASVEGLESTPINLLPRSRHTDAKVDLKGLLLLLAGVVVCIVSYYAVTRQQHQTLSAITQRQQQLQIELGKGQPVRERVELLQQQVSAIDRRRSDQPPPLSLLAEVTRVTPDHTWTRNWILDGSALTLLGETSDTADLLSALEASPLLSEVHYESAITRDDANDRERFRLSARVSTRLAAR